MKEINDFSPYLEYLEDLKNSILNDELSKEEIAEEVAGEITSLNASINEINKKREADEFINEHPIGFTAKIEKCTGGSLWLNVTAVVWNKLVGEKILFGECKGTFKGAILEVISVDKNKYIIHICIKSYDIYKEVINHYYIDFNLYGSKMNMLYKMEDPCDYIIKLSNFLRIIGKPVPKHYLNKLKNKNKFDFIFHKNIRCYYRVYKDSLVELLDNAKEVINI